jgi:hypothetical protein
MRSSRMRIPLRLQLAALRLQLGAQSIHFGALYLLLVADCLPVKGGCQCLALSSYGCRG